MFLLFSFYFHFPSFISFTFLFQILFDVVLHLLFYLVFVLLYLLSILALFIPRNLLSQQYRVKPKNFFLFSSRHIWKHILIFFFRLLFFKGICFKFYVIAVLICYLYFITYCRTNNVFGTLCLFWPSLLLLALKLSRNNVWVALETLCFLRWCVGVFSTFKESCIINF